MRLRLRVGGCLLAAALVVTAGCPMNSRVDYESTMTLQPGTSDARTVDGPNHDQKIAVTVTSADVPVNVYVVREAEVEAARSALEGDKKPTNPLGGKDKVQNETLEVTIPAKTNFGVVVSNAGNKTAQVKLKITGR